MNVKIVIDAGHGGREFGAVYIRRREKDDTLKLALAVGARLKRSGAQVIFTRTSDTYQTPAQRADIANQSGADLFISIHRGMSLKPNTYSGIQTLVHDRSSRNMEIGDRINRELEKIGFQNLGTALKPDLIVLNRTQMTAVLLEVGFMNTEADNSLFDEKMEEIAEAISNAISQACELEQKAQPVHYRVQTGLFRVRTNAENMLQQLINKGYPAFMLHDDGYFKIQVGAFENRENAVRIEEQLRKDGFQTLITTS